MTPRDTFDMFREPERGRFGDNEAAPERGKSRVNDASDLVDLGMVLHAETHPGKKDEGAIRVSPKGDDAAGQWIPKKFVEVERSGRFVAGTNYRGQRVQLRAIKISIPEWLAKEKGLV